MCASPDFEHKDNNFIKQYFPIYKNFFKCNYVFKGNYSDRVYYKSFFDIDKRVIDITNVIIISSDCQQTIGTTGIEDIENLKVDIKEYLKDYTKIK